LDQLVSTFGWKTKTGGHGRVCHAERDIPVRWVSIVVAGVADTRLIVVPQAGVLPAVQETVAVSVAGVGTGVRTTAHTGEQHRHSGELADGSARNLDGQEPGRRRIQSPEQLLVLWDGEEGEGRGVVGQSSRVGRGSGERWHWIVRV